MQNPNIGQDAGDAAAVDQLLQTLMYIVKSLQGLEPWQHCARAALMPLAEQLNNACAQLHRLVTRSGQPGASAAVRAALYSRLVLSMAPAMALRAIATAALAHASMRGGSNDGGSGASSVALSAHRWFGSTVRAPTRRPPTLARLLSRATIACLPPTLIPSAVLVLDACKQLQALIAEQARAALTDVASSSPSSTPQHPHPSLQLPLLLQEQLRTPGARVAALLVIKKAVVRIDVEADEKIFRKPKLPRQQHREARRLWRLNHPGDSTPSDSDDGGGGSDSGGSASGVETVMKRAVDRKLRQALQAATGSPKQPDAKEARSRIGDLRSALAELTTGLHALCAAGPLLKVEPSPLGDGSIAAVAPLLARSSSSAIGAASGLALSASSCCLPPAGAATAAAGAREGEGDRRLRSVCNGRHAAIAVYALLLDATQVYFNEVFRASLTRACEGRAMLHAVAEQEQKNENGRRGGGGGGGRAAAAAAGVSPAAAEAGKCGDLFCDFMLALAPEPPTVLLRLAVQCLGPVSRALFDVHPTVSERRMGRDGGFRTGRRRSEQHMLLQQVWDVGHTALELIRKTALPVPDRRRIVTLKPDQWPEAATLAMLLMARSARWLRGLPEQGEPLFVGSHARVLLQDCPDPVPPARGLATDVEPPSLVQVAVPLLQHLLHQPGGKEESGAGAGTGDASPPAAAGEHAGGGGDAADSEGRDRRALALVPELCEAVAASCAVVEQSAVRQLKGYTLHRLSVLGSADQAYVDAASTVRKCCLLVEPLLRRWADSSVQRLSQWGPGKDNPALAAAMVVWQLAAAAEALLVLQWHLPQSPRALELSRIAASLVLPPLCELAWCLTRGWLAIASESAAAEEQAQQAQQAQQTQQATQQQAGLEAEPQLRPQADAAACAAAAAEGCACCSGRPPSPPVRQQPAEPDGVGTTASGRVAPSGGAELPTPPPATPAAAAAAEQAGCPQAWRLWEPHGIMAALRRVTAALALVLLAPAALGRQGPGGEQPALWEARLAVACNANWLLNDVVGVVSAYRDSVTAAQPSTGDAETADGSTELSAGTPPPDGVASAPRSGEGAAAASPPPLASGGGGVCEFCETAEEAAAEEACALLTHVCLLWRKTLDLLPPPPPPPPPPGPTAGSSGHAAPAQSVAEHVDQCLVSGWWAVDMLKSSLVLNLLNGVSMRDVAAGGVELCEGKEPNRLELSLAGLHLAPLLAALRARLLPLAAALVAGAGGLAPGATAGELREVADAACEAGRAAVELGPMRGELVRLQVQEALNDGLAEGSGGACTVAAEDALVSACKRAYRALWELACKVVHVLAHGHESLDWTWVLQQPDAGGWPAWMDAAAEQQSRGGGKRHTPSIGPRPADAHGCMRKHGSAGGAAGARAAAGPGRLLQDVHAARQARFSLGALLLSASAAHGASSSVSNGTRVASVNVCFNAGCVAVHGDDDAAAASWQGCTGCDAARFCSAACMHAALQGHCRRLECAVLRAMHKGRAEG